MSHLPLKNYLHGFTLSACVGMTWYHVFLFIVSDFYTGFLGTRV
jgi:hypothetical protein